MKYWTPVELLRILAEAKKVSCRNHLLILLAYQHGLRATELCRLTLKNVSNGRIDCRRLKGSLHTDQPLESNSNILLDEKRALQAYLRERGNSSEPFLFLGRVSQAARERWAGRRRSTLPERQLTTTPVTGISRFTVTDVFEDAGMRAGIERGRRKPHAAKHTLGKTMYLANVSLLEMRLRLGHQDIKSTSHYVELSQDEVANRVRGKMAAIFA